MTAASIDRDWSLHSGERQTASRFHEIRVDHRARYAWAAEQIGFSTRRRVLDVFCGTGYGTQYLAEMTGALTIGVDGSRESIDFANEHYAHPRVQYFARVFPIDWLPIAADVVVCFESLEHVADDAGFTHTLAQSVAPGGLLLLSVPNERAIPRATFGNPFHVRHYTRDDVLAEFCDRLDLTLEAWAGQSKDGAFRSQTEDRTLVFAFRRPTEAPHA